MVLLGENNSIAVSRGDSAYIIFDITGDVPENGTKAIFTVKKDINGKAVMIKELTISESTAEIALTKHDTNKLVPGDYYWDFRILYSDDDVASPVVPSLFKVLGVVGDV